MSRRQIAGKRVVLSGASSGIGWHLAQQLVAAGARVVVNARRAERLQELVDSVSPPRPSPEGNVSIVAVPGDITDQAVQQALLEAAVKHFGGMDILINNAGIGAMGRFDDSAEDRVRRIFEVNFFAIVALIRRALPLLKQGHQPIIVNMSSVLAHRAAPLKSEYSASKFALHGFSDALRAELAQDQVDLLLISPSTTDSEFFDQAEDSTGVNWKKRGAMPPEQVAAKTIRAIAKGKHEIILTHGGRMMVWLDRLIPGIANRVMARFGQ